MPGQSLAGRFGVGRAGPSVDFGYRVYDPRTEVIGDSVDPTRESPKTVTLAGWFSETGGPPERGGC